MSYPEPRYHGERGETAKAAGQKFTDEEWKDICIRHDNYFI
jgi:hypothetical protein